jgi:hypothetical protein
MLEIQRVEATLSTIGHVTIHVTANVNLKGYALLAGNRHEKGLASCKHRFVYFFPEMEVKEGDVIKLYSGTGKDVTQEVRLNGIDWISISVHEFYCKDVPHWKDDTDYLYLIQLEIISESAV